MLDRIVQGEVPSKHHVALRSKEGTLRYEHCITREGFDGPYTIAYHVSRPYTARTVPPRFQLPPADLVPPGALRRRHYVTPKLPQPNPGVGLTASRVPLLGNADVLLSMVQGASEDSVYFVNGDADELHFVFQGGGVLRTLLGDLTFARNDYVYIPRGMPYRWAPTTGMAQSYFTMECFGGAHLPKQWRNSAGQLRMDAPYCHRDFQRPTFNGPQDEGIRHTVVKRNGAYTGFESEGSPLDVVGWDGAVYPWVFPILNFQPRVSSVHLPPTWHGTFGARGALICSFVPRPVDFHPEAIPCPYPHSSVDVDEVLFYCDGNFTSRKGVGPASISFHPAGLPHGPHPGAYEGSLGSKHTTELAVMLDCFLPLFPTAYATSIEDPNYHESFA